ncbi:O-antigen ligase family protein [Mucilaginibacter gotjawali]|uniref:O-antigen ligase n=1 Tax=Mucilaginibacter gotjawali TaxID=1550579 RepID=A0A839SDJ5_9SPHI|nr:O-antigen ligase family protein [Mucilaginibacter gotjawali]MBB3054637.1 O-antigen ligase [Mucilaginibacter gotjawali]
MNGLLLIKDNLANRISYYHVILFMASLPFNMFYSHLILASLFIHTLIHLNKNTIKPIFKWRTVVLASVFIVTVLSTVYTINPKEGFNEWAKHITILLFPLIFCLNPLDLKRYRQQFLLAFSFACTATIIYLYADALVTIKHYGLPYSNLFSAAFTNHNFSEPIDLHATFFSMQIAVALIFLLSVLLKEKSVDKKVLYLFCSLILSAGIIQLSSKSIVIATIILVNIALPWFLLKAAARLKFMLGSAALSVLLIIVVLNSGTFKERFINEFKADLSKSNQTETSDSRVARWYAATALIRKAPIIGYGAGSEIGLMQEAFYKDKLYSSYLNRLNVHSQYISFLLKSGIIGLVIYLSTLAFGFKIAFRHKDLLFFSFLVIVAIVSFSENLLDVDKGVIFYAFFFSFFFFLNEEDGNNGFPVKIHPSAINHGAVVLEAKSDFNSAGIGQKIRVEATGAQV